VLKYTEDLKGWMRELGLSLTADQLVACLEYAQCVFRANETTNVTSIRDAREFVRLHVLDSLTACPELAEAPAGSLVDIGTGGGFPGQPLSVASGRHCTLLDSVGRKTEVIARCISAAEYGQTGLEAVNGRSETLALEHPGGFAAATARAVADLPVVLELARPLLADSGLLIALKGQLSAEELGRADAAADRLGMKVAGVRRFKLPEGSEDRCVVTYRVVGDAAVALPRRPGMASKRPLS